MTKAAGRGRRVRAPRSGEQPVAARRPNRLLLPVPAAVALIATATGVLAATQRGPRTTRRRRRGVVQAYLAGVIDGDHDQAARFLAAASPCSVADLDRAYLPDGIRVVLHGERARPPAAWSGSTSTWQCPRATRSVGSRPSRSTPSA